MSYLVLARKYRPRTFDEVVGQETVTRTLRNALASGRIGHAFNLRPVNPAMPAARMQQPLIQLRFIAQQ